MSELEVIALVTGASRGIGRAIAIELAGNKAYTVIGTATTAQGADSIGTYLAEVKAKGEGLVVDVASDDSVTGLINTIKEKYGAPAVLVNNAGITRDNLLMRMQSEEWSAVIDTNLGSMYRVCKACVRGMTKARWGRIINISSVVASSGNAGQTNYAASKAGIIGMSKSLAIEYAKKNITINCVSPGFIVSDMTMNIAEKVKLYLTTRIPMGKLGSGDDVSNCVAFLSSDQASYITGETLHVNGGMYMA